MTLRVSRIAARAPRRAAIVASYPLLVAGGALCACLVGLQWFADAQLTLAASARRAWRLP